MVRFSRVCRAVVRMSHPQVIRFRQLMRDDGGNTLKSQDNRKGLRTLPLNVMECEKSDGGSQPMGFQVRDDRQMKALTGLSQAQFDNLLPVFSNIYGAMQQKHYEEGVASGTRRRKPGGGTKGKLPTMTEKLLFVLYYYKTYPTFDVLGTQFDMARSKANENLHKLSPILYDTLVYLEMMPYREFSTPDDFKAALKGIDQLIMDATERAYRRSSVEAKHREHDSGKKKSIR